jgi:hypothetical protein
MLCATAGTAQTLPAAHADDRAPSQKGLEALLNRVTGLPAEYKADLAFTIIDAAPSSLSSARRRALLDDVFHSADSAYYPYYEIDAAQHHKGTAPGLAHLTSNFLQRLHSDTLEIQKRAIEHALPLTPQFANHLFEELNLREVRASCKEAAVEDVSAFYSIAAQIIGDERIKTVFKEDKPLYLQSLAAEMRIPAQIAPLATLITQASVSAEQLSQIQTAFVSSLGTITASDREMTAAETAGHLTHTIELLSEKMAQSNVSSEPLLVTYRGFLLRGLTRERCADYSLDRGEMAKTFNALLPSTIPESADISPLSEAQLYPKSIGDTASDEIVPFNEQLAPQMKRISIAHQARFGEEYRLGQPGTVEPEPSDVEDVVKYALALGPSDSTCSVCDFCSKSSILLTLVDLLPAGQQLERAITAEIGYLSFNSVQRDNPTAWLSFLKDLVNISRKSTENGTAVVTAEAKKGRLLVTGLPSPEAVVIRDNLRRSSDPIISTYMLAEDLLRLPYRPGL